MVGIRATTCQMVGIRATTCLEVSTRATTCQMVGIRETTRQKVGFRVKILFCVYPKGHNLLGGQSAGQVLYEITQIFFEFKLSS